MGTSLSGLTPATTFDGLLKVGDNDPLTADLKAISTGDGTDTILSLSNSALQVNGQATIVGAGNDNTTNSLLVQNSDGTQLLKMVDDGSSILGNDTHNVNVGSDGYVNIVSNRVYSTGSRFYYNSGNGYIARLDADGFQVGNGSSVAAATIHAKGSGATSATTSLLVQNSAGTENFRIYDDGTINLGAPGDNPTIQSGSNAGKSLTLGSTATLSALNINLSTYNGVNYTPVLSVTGNTDQFVGIGETTPTARLQVKGSGNDATTTALLVQNSDAADMLKVTDDRNIETYDATGNVISKNDAATSTFVINPSLTSDVDFRVAGGGGKVNLLKVDSGLNSVSIGTGGVANTRLVIKGDGATSATTALLVQNSAETELLKVRDDGNVYATSFRASQMLYNGTLLMLSNRIYNTSTSNGALTFNTNNLSYNDSAIPTPIASAAFQVDSTTKGFLPPRMTDAERDAITTPAPGLMVYDTSNNQMNYWNGAAWIAF